VPHGGSRSVRRRVPRRLGTALKDVVASRSPDSLLAAVQAGWSEALGPELASAASPVRERDGVITVECRSGAWASELELMQGELVARLQSAIGRHELHGLRFAVERG
jgi:predicted nucleic acid-binding Zn ribbon protein